MADTTAPQEMTDDEVFASFDSDFDSIVAGEPAPAPEVEPEPEPEPAPEAAPEPEQQEAAPEEDIAEAAVEPESEAEPSALAEDEVPEPSDRDPAWYQRAMGKVRRQRKAAREELDSLRQEFEALKAQRAAPAPQQPSQPQPNRALTQQQLMTAVAQEMGIDPETATDFEIRTVQMLAGNRYQMQQQQAAFDQMRQADLARQVQALESRVKERVSENPFLTREELLHAESRGIDMDEYIADRRMAFDSYLASQGYVRADQQQTKAPPKPMPVPSNKGKSRKQTAAPNTTPQAPKSYDNDNDFWGDFDTELDKHFSS